MKIVIYGKPIPKMRARHANRGSFVVTYDPQDKDKRIVRNIMTEQLHDYSQSLDKKTVMEMSRICAGKVFSVSFIFFLPVNLSDSVSQRNKKLWGLIPAATKPDYDNLEKFYLDCANGILWGDDAAIIKGQALKVYDANPRVEIVVEAINELRLDDKIEKVISSFSPEEFVELQEHARKLAEMAPPDRGMFGCKDLEDWVVSAAFVLSNFALKYAPKLTKISKLGEINSERSQENPRQLTF